MTAIAGQNILFLSLPRHDGPFQSTPWQIAAVLARDNKVYFADHPYTFVEALSGFWKRPIWNRLKAYFGSPLHYRNRVNVIYLPFVWPLNFLPEGRLYDLISRWNHRLISTRINKVLSGKNIQSFLYVNSFDFYFPVLDTYLRPIPQSGIYHCIDPLVKPFSLKHGVRLEHELAMRSDVIISTAPALQRKFLHLPTMKNYLVPNGVEVSHFIARAERRGMKVAQFSALKGKVLGYFGNIERRIDYALLLGTIDLLPDWTLVLAGPVELKYVPEKLVKHPRVIFTNAIPYDQAPVVVARFDVAIIPFLCDEVSAGIYPLKLFEYLAAGKPIVTTNFNPEVLDPLSEFIYRANTPEAFSRKVRLAADTNSDRLTAERVKIASENSWEERSLQFGLILDREIHNTVAYVS